LQIKNNNKANQDKQQIKKSFKKAKTAVKRQKRRFLKWLKKKEAAKIQKKTKIR
jgi:hypothetical protein